MKICKDQRVQKNLNRRCSEVRVISSPKEKAVGPKFAIICGHLNRIVGKISSQLSRIGAGCPGNWCHGYPCQFSKDLWVWCLETWLSGGLDSSGLATELTDLGDIFQP